MGDFKQLRAWQEARKLAILSRRVIRKLPTEERYALASQWRRAVYSVSLNIAEGASRRGPREFRKYLDTARSSLHEIEAILELVVGLGYLSDFDVAEVRNVRSDCARMVYGLMRAMDRTSRQG